MAIFLTHYIRPLSLLSLIILGIGCSGNMETYDPSIYRTHSYHSKPYPLNSMVGNYAPYPIDNDSYYYQPWPNGNALDWWYHYPGIPAYPDNPPYTTPSDRYPRDNDAGYIPPRGYESFDYPLYFD